MKLRSMFTILATAAFGLFVLSACGGDDGGNTGNDSVDEDTNQPDLGPDGECTPFCAAANACGADGCGGSCGTCTNGQTCNADGVCEGTICEPQCTGKTCGPDGCTGSCGTCPTGQTCTAAGACEVCAPQCTDKECGSDACGGTCGTCDTGETCDAYGKCQVCAPQCTGKACGPDGCGGTCGTCPTGQDCNLTGQCVAGKQPLGGACGPDAVCRPPEAGAPDTATQEYFDCLNAQCDTDLCFAPYCSKFCAISKDQTNNTTGAAGADGVDDTDAPNNDCAGGVDGIVGPNLRCVNISPAGYQPTGICYPGTTLAKCGSSADCPQGETCAVTYIGGTYESRCQTNIKGGSEDIATACNDDPMAGDVAYCANGFCFTIGCSAFCASNGDCQTANACQGGKCANNQALSCTTDADCSSWECKKDMELSSDGWKDDVCFPKACYKEADCPDSAFFCRPFIADTMDKFEGSCMMKPENVVPFGEVCDENPDDNIPGPICQNPYLCMGGYCGGMCGDDVDCATDKDQKCTVAFEYNLDEDEDGTDDAYLPLWACQTFPGTSGDCLVASECAGGANELCLWYESGPEAGELELSGQCLPRDAAKGNYGDLCGAAVNMNCNSGLCLGSDPEANVAGFCTETCLAQTDCPASVTLEGTLYKSVCRALLWGWNGTMDRLDDLYLPVCLPTADTDSLADCSADYSCATAGEGCVPMVIASNPDVAGKVDWLCMAMGDTATLALGAVCEPNPADDYAGATCTSGLCMPDVEKAKGYCSEFCKTDNDCSNGYVCHAYPYVDRANDAFDVIVPRCQKAATCIPCAENADCTDGYSCVNVGGLGFTADYRCAPTCMADADCTGTDGGATCKDSKDKVGNADGQKACIPANNTCK